MIGEIAVLLVVFGVIAAAYSLLAGVAWLAVEGPGRWRRWRRRRRARGEFRRLVRTVEELRHGLDASERASRRAAAMNRDLRRRVEGLEHDVAHQLRRGVWQ